jgi:uncharacterized protein YbjT (DUF2867 family)
MQIAIFGSTGRLGAHLVSQALEAGHSVTAAARTPERVSTRHPELTTVQCDVLQPETLPAAVQGADVVMVSLTGPGQTRSQGTANILAAMSASGVDRILIVSTIGVGESINQLSLAGRAFVRTVIRSAVSDHSRQETLVRDSGVRWTIARPGGLTNADLSGSYRASPDGTIRVGQVPRADVAHFLLRSMDDASTEGKTYALSS